MAKKKTYLYKKATPNVWRVSKSGTGNWCIRVSCSERDIVIADDWFQIYPLDRESERMKKLIIKDIADELDEYRAARIFRPSILQAVHNYIIQDMSVEDGYACYDSIGDLPGITMLSDRDTPEIVHNKTEYSRI